MSAAGAIPRIEQSRTNAPVLEPVNASRGVTLVIDPSNVRRFEVELLNRLLAAGLHVAVRFGRASTPLPSSVRLLLQLERLVFHLKGPLLRERVSAATLDPSRSVATGTDDAVLNLCNDPAVEAASGVRVLYDGVAGEAALVAALIDGRMPVIEIEDSRRHAILARGIACADNARTLSEALECVLARVLILITAAFRNDHKNGPRPVPPRQSRRGVAGFELKALASAAASRLYHLCCYAPHWRVQWRFVEGVDLWESKTLRDTSWNVMPDPGDRFYADPFPFVQNGETFVFVEDLDHRTNKGVISVIPFDRKGPIGPARPVLEEPWHLSYPFMLAHNGHIWMIPESSANKTVTLYRADPFPHRWVPEAILLSDVEASDATVIQRDGVFWMFAATRDGFGSWSDTLSIYWARDLRGPWSAHAGNPVLIDQAAARPAGAMVERNGHLWRPVQDCTNGYGTGIGLAEVTALDNGRFEQRVDTVLRAEPQWPGRRFHTLNRAGAIECIDGAAYSPRNRALARWFEQRSGRREEPPEWRNAAH